MRAFRSQLAILLLLCFVRVLLPESAILALHRHQHTEKEAAHTGRGYKALLTAKHQHCPVDHLFDVPFQPTPELVLQPVVHRYAPLKAEPYQSVWQSTTPAAAYLRGPPARA
ncbi:hypothetical protein [Hymenobacter latericus]|uniref:hypothetical protein n=1 Tax=Hymenobacter sp. YIM 151858-1 TaxID=2987688 RepID=UPI002227D4E5|nr:hypothetical protein [Hymenobacter sp. YIM 151858-1]UYZ58629.1 hypothetical protein OIS50_16395 [Hymenobacter sp. YIM 151858-1]